MRTVRTPTVDDVLRARDVVQRHLEPTPIVRRHVAGHEVVFKLETLQPTGSFKVRGGLVAVDAVAGRDPRQPIITASAGNHGLGVAYAATTYGADATVVIPENTSTAKRGALERFAVTLVAAGSGYHDAEEHALRLAADGAAFISPYNDPRTIAGQGSIALELFEQAPEVRTIVAPIGGGGLVSGLALAATTRPGVRVVGVQAAASPAITAAVASGTVTTIRIEPTLADGLAGNLEPGAITIDLIREHVHDIVDVSEDEIVDAIRFMASEHGLIIEGAAAVGVAALRAGRVGADGVTAVVLTGRNIAHTTLARILNGDA